MQDRDERRFGIDRRMFLKLGAGFGTTALLGWANPASAAVARRQKFTPATEPRAGARACVFIFLNGAISHVDSFDLKKGSWTPNSLGVQRLSTGIDWPAGTMPNLAQRAGRFSIVRSLVTQEAAHERAQYYLETARRLNPGLRTEIPHMGALIAYDFEQKGRTAETDSFPGFVRFGATATDNGFLSAKFAPFGDTGIQVFAPGGAEAFDKRLALLKLLNTNDPLGPSDPVRQPLPIFQQQAEKLMRDPVTAPTFNVNYSDADVTRYGGNYLAYNLVLTRNLLKANRGARFIEVNHYGWDNHQKIYTDTTQNGFLALSGRLDRALSAFIDDLSGTPGVAAGKSLLDETLIVVMGEFGRTAGEPNRDGGRDHYPYAFSALFAGGGVKGGRVVGETDSIGKFVTDPGWSNERPIHLPDVATTIYSALGIDWLQVLEGTPSGRPFYYVDPLAIGDPESYEITPLFE